MQSVITNAAVRFYGPHARPRLEVGWVFGCQKLSVSPWSAQFISLSPSQVPNGVRVFESSIAKEQPENLYDVFGGCDEDDRERQTVHTDPAGIGFKKKKKLKTAVI